MKYTISILFIILFFSLSYANEEKLKSEYEQLIKQRVELQNQIQKIEIRLIEIQGVVKYLDAEKKVNKLKDKIK